MRIIDITHPPKDLWIGRENENTFRPVSFECANWFSNYPNATITAYYQPYGANDPYPLVLTIEGTKRIWQPLSAELVKGDGELQIVLMDGNTVGTSAIIPTKVDRSLISSADHPAEDAPSWTVQVVADVTEQADRAEEAASHYPKIVNGIWYVWSVQAEDFVSTGIEAQGDTGDSAYEEAVALGFVGTEAEWIASLKGETGANGRDGQDGAPGTPGRDGVSPTVQTTAITGGHRVTITDADHPQGQSFDVMDGMSEAFKQALLSVVQAIGAWSDDDAQGHYDVLYNALYPPVGLVSISATINTGGAVIYEGDPLNSIKPYLTVLANYDDGTSDEVTGYLLSGELNQAVSAVTVSYARKTTVVNVPVTMLMITDVLTLDGILNSRNGHDSTATTWEDLSESRNDFTKVSGANNSVWADDHAIYNGTDRRIEASANPMIGISQMTFEAVVKITGNGSYLYNGTYWAALFDDADWDETDSLRFATRNNNMFSARLGNTTVLGSTVGVNTIAYIAITAVNGTAIAYVNGEAVKTTEISFPPTTRRTSRVGGYKSSQNNYFPNAEIYRIGISSRAMTAEEIAERYAFFQDRFNFGGESA